MEEEEIFFFPCPFRYGDPTTHFNPLRLLAFLLPVVSHVVSLLYIVLSPGCFHCFLADTLFDTDTFAFAAFLAFLLSTGMCTRIRHRERTRV